MNDYLVRATALDGKLRAFACITTELVRELSDRNNALALASAALGRTATMAAIMGVMLKGKETVTLQIRGDGPLGRIVATADSEGHVRGYVENPQVELPPNDGIVFGDVEKLDVGSAVGEGFLFVIKDLGLKEPYIGSVPLATGEIGDDFLYYFAQSEQTPSALGLGVLVGKDQTVTQAGGFLLQLLPGVSDEDIDYIEDQIKQFPHVTTLLEKGHTPEQILQRLIPGEVNFNDKVEIRFQCDCSRDRFARGLISLGEAELVKIVEEDKQAELSCHFCGEVYHFNEAELLGLVTDAKRD
ncbi:redox-regulated molecular chaperone Hsp33 [Tumebacillus algifaecis]|uniref:33 kDa chaperonin n=1 Tax=Tumebacillus algifaecis TaxID=1214604 RepID=A0A223D6F2_9BACL|nr:Hsp33 family molecular chaperone HslO [Tumebacillus algifaecis]ASS76976.1 redox-regulated molecular chaperone Hsp33 [Tumebacillus algifaecis]